jgi:hypothetical protein
MEQHIHRPWDPSFAEFSEFAKAVTELGGVVKGRRHVEVLRRGKYWVVYKVVRDNGVKVGYVNWRDFGYLAFVKINLAKGCVIYFSYPLVEIYKLTGHDVAGLMEIDSVGDLLRFIESHVRDSSGRTPRHLPITEW